jgi:coenzyme F420-0:L-glutamate ligase/coenzyme F420-1:gamma-L-glutamate ligase
MSRPASTRAGARQPGTPATSERAVEEAPSLLAARRSVRSFLDVPVTDADLEALVDAAALAPAPHHSRPWRFATVAEPTAKAALAEHMGARWRSDLRADGLTDAKIDELVARSHRIITGAPALVLACLTTEGLDDYPDEPRRRAEWTLAVLSLGAAVENLMLAATERGLATCWVAAPAFCPDEARAALALPATWVPQALVLVGRADPAYRPRPRAGSAGELRLRR